MWQSARRSSLAYYPRDCTAIQCEEQIATLPKIKCGSSRIVPAPSGMTVWGHVRTRTLAPEIGPGSCRVAGVAICSSVIAGLLPAAKKIIPITCHCEPAPLYFAGVAICSSVIAGLLIPKLYVIANPRS